MPIYLLHVILVLLFPSNTKQQTPDVNNTGGLTWLMGFGTQLLEDIKYNIEHPISQPDQVVFLRHYPDVVDGKVGQTINFTIRVFDSKESMANNQSMTSSMDIEIFWNTTSSFIKPLPEDRNITLHSSNNFIGSVTLDSSNNFTGTVSITSTLIGIYYMEFYTSDKRPIKNNKVEIAVQRQDETLNKIINLLFAVALTIALFFMGMDIDLSIILETVKRPIGPFLGMICQFGLMPGLAYLFGYLFLITRYERLGLLLLGCSPGGAFSNCMTLLFGGDLNLSVTMTFFSTVASFAMTTVWIYLLGAPLVAERISIPYIRMGISLASFTLPALLGVWFKHKKPLAAEKVKAWISRPFFLAVLVLTPIAVSATNWFFFYLCSWRHIVSGTLLAVCGYLFGGILAVIFCQKRAQIIAISMETAIQNVGIPLISLNLTFQSPYSDMGILPIISYFFFSTGPIMFVIYGVYILSQKICGNKSKEDAFKNRRNSVDGDKAVEDLLLTNYVNGDKAVEELLLTDALNDTELNVKLIPATPIYPSINEEQPAEPIYPIINQDQLDKESSINNEIIIIPIIPDTDEGAPQIRV